LLCLGVQDILKNCLEMQVSPNICLTLVAPLFKHAIRHDTSNLDIYVDMIVDLYVYLNNCAMVDDNVIFRQVADLFLGKTHSRIIKNHTTHNLTIRVIVLVYE